VGEAAAQVFPVSSLQKINKVAVGFAAPLGGSGAVATANVEIYDGITWNSGIPTLGTKVFDLNVDQSSDMQLTSTTINELDLSTLNINVGNGTSHFVVAIRMTFNPNGNCAGGYTSNLFTDNGTGGCSTTPMTSLIDLSGQGWRDASTATVSGFPLCPLFYNGNWVIRACTSDVSGGTGQFVDLGFNKTGTFAPMLSGSGSLAGGEIFTLTFSGQPPSTTAFLWFDLVAVFAPFKGGTLVPGTAVLVNFPTPAQVFMDTDIPLSLPMGIPSATSLYWQAWYQDAGGIFGTSATNGLETITP